MDSMSEKIQSEKKHSRREMGISWRLFGMLLIFIVVMLLIIWIFQVVLLNKFYEQSKMEEFEITNEAIVSSLGDELLLERTVFSYSIKFDECIRVFGVKDGVATQIKSADINAGCVIHHISADELSSLYSKAKQNGGRYIKKVSIPAKAESSEMGTIFISIERLDNGEEYVIMLNSEFAPLNATVSTLERQFGWIACILLLGAVVLVIIISRTICAPMEKMSASAKLLAKGDYNAKFSGGGYRESQELADALNYASEELKKTNNLQKELVANISHDLRTPLTMIKGYSEVMRDIPEENTPENVQVIIDETERLTSLVNDMLDLSKLRAGTRKPEKSEFNLTETVREVMNRYGKLTEKDGYNISFSADRDVFIDADNTMILQVVYNLINNAINYTGEDKTVRVTQSVSDNKVRISVSDTGVGISPEDLPLIWDRYYKVDKVHRRAMVGTGLGLSIVKGILEAHDAYYGVESKLGEGSTFWFEIKLAK